MHAYFSPLLTTTTTTGHARHRHLAARPARHTTGISNVDTEEKQEIKKNEQKT